MELLLLDDIPGVGRKNDLVIVGDGFALNHLLPARKALVATPNVRRRYAEQIKRRAEEKETERAQRSEVAHALSNKTVSLSRKATKTGKLYAAVSEITIAEAIKDQHAMSVEPADITIIDQIKSVGTHIVQISAGGELAQVTVDVKAE